MYYSFTTYHKCTLIIAGAAELRKGWGFGRGYSRPLFPGKKENIRMGSLEASWASPLPHFKSLRRLSSPCPNLKKIPVSLIWSDVRSDFGSVVWTSLQVTRAKKQQTKKCTLTTLRRLLTNVKEKDKLEDRQGAVTRSNAATARLLTFVKPAET